MFSEMGFELWGVGGVLGEDDDEDLLVGSGL